MPQNECEPVIECSVRGGSLRGGRKVLAGGVCLGCGMPVCFSGHENDVRGIARGVVCPWCDEKNAFRLISMSEKVDRAPIEPTDPIKRLNHEAIPESTYGRVYPNPRTKRRRNLSELDGDYDWRG